jgi:hypothetical protein
MLGEWLAEQVITESNIKTIVVIYPGRFQPMGRHHAETYKKLAAKFGKSNTYIATSDKVKLPKSPLNFKEKRKVIFKHGIGNVVQVKNPYQATEITSKYDPETTAVLFAVGAKDMQEDPRFRIGTKKDGSPGYFQSYEQNKNTLQPYTQHGYLVVAPHVKIAIPGFDEMSGTTLRKVLATADPDTFKDVMGFYDESVYTMLRDKFSAIKTEQIESFISKYDITQLLKEGSITAGGKHDVDDGPRYFYGNQSTYNKQTSAMATRLGYQVVNYLMPNTPIETHNTNFPDGPPLSVSYFPTGVKGAKNSGTDYMRDMKGNPAYNAWRKYINKVAQQVGYKFMDFLGAGDSVASSKGEKLKPTGLREDINLPINIGDTVMMGRFKNKKVVVKTIGWNEKGDLLINGRSAMRLRIPPKDQELTKEWWSNQLGELLTEAKANTHLTHLEELILTQGAKGYKTAKSFLIELLKNLKGNSNSKIDTTVKWDGAPAVFAGINPDNGKFFVGTKSVMNKVPKINYTMEDIEMNHGEAPGLVFKLKFALQHLPALGIKNILQGDFMFDKSMVKSTNIDGEPHLSFRPNTITYAVESNSDIGRKVAAAKIGIVFHTTYNNGLQGGATFGADVSGLRRNPNVWFDDAYFKDTTGIVTLTAKEAKEVAALIKKADSIKINYDNLPSAELNIYLNAEIKTGQFVDNAAISFKAFQKWLEQRIDKKIAKLKSDRGIEKATLAKQQRMSVFNERKQDILNIFTVSKLLAEAKLIFVRKYNNAISITKHFKDDGKGGLVVTAPEGYVAVDHIGQGVKFVDRIEFSRANFAMDKGFTK